MRTKTHLMLPDLIPHFGAPTPLGFSTQGNLSNFALFSSSAQSITLGLREAQSIREIPLNRTGNVWHTGIEGSLQGIDYAFRTPDSPLWLNDPYARFFLQESGWSQCKIDAPFDWQETTKPAIPFSKLIIYEMHVRGFTKHPSSQTTHPGTYLGIIEKIPYLKQLGINAIELMPIFSFDPTHNYWGYDPLSFFTPLDWYASASPQLEFKTLVRELHRNGIEVLLDVVYNHTGEGKANEPPHSFRGIDNSVYYLSDEKRHPLDFSGCGNTFNSNHPVVTQLILDSLHYWVQEMQVDGFRFDLAAIHTRGPDGKMMKHPPLLEKIAIDPILSQTKLIAEAWDASGLYLVGSFPHYGPWSVWNGKFRDRTRLFLNGTDGYAGKFADVLSGSEFLFAKYSPLKSINFVTAHDGFSLTDLVSYNQKHNIANGEEGLDGSSQNYSWNSGVEGPTADPSIEELRDRQKRNFLLALFLAQGVPMLLMGDEYGHTRHGNNNPYTQDNDLNWFLWNTLDKNHDMFDFVSGLIAFRKAHPALRKERFLTAADVTWHGTHPERPDWEQTSHLVAYTLQSTPPLFIAFNASHESATVSLPHGTWGQIVDTQLPWNAHHFRTPPKKPISSPIELIPYSAILLRHLA